MVGHYEMDSQLSYYPHFRWNASIFLFFKKKLSSCIQYGLGGAYRWKGEYGIPSSSWVMTASRRCRDTTLTRTWPLYPSDMNFTHWAKLYHTVTHSSQNMACINSHSISISIWPWRSEETYLSSSECYIALNAAKWFTSITVCFIRLCDHFGLRENMPHIGECFWKACASCS